MGTLGHIRPPRIRGLHMRHELSCHGLKPMRLRHATMAPFDQEMNRKITGGEREYLAVCAGLVAEGFEDLVVVAVLRELILAAIARRRRSLRRLFSLSLHVGILVPDVIPSQEPPASTSIDLPPADKEGSAARSPEGSREAYVGASERGDERRRRSRPPAGKRKQREETLRRSGAGQVPADRTTAPPILMGGRRKDRCGRGGPMGRPRSTARPPCPPRVWRGAKPALRDHESEGERERMAGITCRQADREEMGVFVRISASAEAFRTCKNAISSPHRPIPLPTLEDRCSGMCPSSFAGFYAHARGTFSGCFVQFCPELPGAGYFVRCCGLVRRHLELFRVTLFRASQGGLPHGKLLRATSSSDFRGRPASYYHFDSK
ncbi:hypothetical protein MUK42_24791 [Musa troglodytarum]|uniref:Uncharacterized protein n=1 Tax=Musa troglodytarum TaxID=320322 RepID=A0A9E7I3P2_9LILI|nr:hypothetical protein MUK42_24791 [Musa troglodytarum]